jgi:hypothetical protein
MRPLLVLALLAPLAARPAAAQTACRPPDNSNEAKVLATFDVPLAFGPLGAPARAAPGSVRIGVEGAYLPRLDSVTRTPTFCRPGKGPENTNLIFAVPRPRVAIGLPGGVLLEGSWLPPVRVSGVRPNIGSVSLARGFPVGAGALNVGLRVHASFGVVHAPITCPAAELQDATSECYQGTESDDRFHPDVFGGEGAIGWALAGGRFRPYLGGGINLLRPRFQVNFVNRFGALDDTRVEVNLTRGVVFGGATWAPLPGLGVAGEVYAAPADAVTGRLALSYTLR